MVQGNFLSGVDITTFVANLLVVLREPNPTSGQFNAFIDQMRGVYNQGVLASILGFFVGGYFEKTDSNVAGARVVGPDGYTLVVEENGHVAAVLGFDSNDIQAFLGVTGLTAAIGLEIAALPGIYGATATVNLPLFSQYLTNLVWPASAGPIIPAHLTEFYSDGFNGDTQVPAPFVDIDLSRPVWRENATNLSDILHMQFPGTLNSGGGDDVVFGNDLVIGGIAEGHDVIYGGAGDDVIWGRGGDDQIFGGTGKDVLRGGAGDDTLYGNGETEAGPNGPAPAADNEADFFSGGAGDDKYYVGDKDVIRDDSDGKGEVHFGTFLLTGGTSMSCGAPTSYTGRHGEVYSQSGSNLTVTFTIGGVAKYITIEGWSDGQLGITLMPADPSTCGTGPGGGPGGGGTPDRYASPIVLDLDGDGLELTNGRTTAVYFDIDGDGLRELTNWVMPDDGLLVFDANGNGVVDGAGELFGYGTSGSIGTSLTFLEEFGVVGGQPANSVLGFNSYELQSYTSGYEKLALFDTNLDGMISAADGAGYTSLRVWRDLNQDGRSEANELFSLSDVGVMHSFVQSRICDIAPIS